MLSYSQRRLKANLKPIGALYQALEKICHNLVVLEPTKQTSYT